VETLGRLPRLIRIVEQETAAGPTFWITAFAPRSLAYAFGQQDTDAIFAGADLIQVLGVVSNEDAAFLAGLHGQGEALEPRKMRIAAHQFLTMPSEQVALISRQHPPLFCQKASIIDA
jgi:hypothetical protein